MDKNTKLSQILRELRLTEIRLDKYVRCHEQEIRNYFRAMHAVDKPFIELICRTPMSTRIALVELMLPFFAGKALMGMSLHDQTRCIANVSEEQRLLIIKEFDHPMTSMWLSNLKHLQELEIRRKGRILLCTIMTGELPISYPTDMRACVSCGNDYKVWQNVYTAECMKHSYHEDCRAGDLNECPLRSCEEENL
jgi:hypothetical protein